MPMSEYTPHSAAACFAGLAAVRQRLAEINSRREAGIADLFGKIKEVVVVASSSRGGSSIFTEILRRSPDLLHCKGEITPFLNLAGLNRTGGASDSDRLPALAAEPARPGQGRKLTILEHEMALDLGVNRPVDLREAGNLERFGLDLLWRLTCQWPKIEIDADFLAACLAKTMAELQSRHGWQPVAFDDPQLFHIVLLRHLRKRYSKINPWYYDLAPGLIRRHCPEAHLDHAPPGELVLEEPPFVTIGPTRPVPTGLLGRSILVLKTPGNVYRLDFFRKLFPKARLRILHLVRHPAAAINGLVDGWLHHCFFSQQVEETLRIGGYSDRFPEWARTWWKYDLPPGWRGWTEKPLVEVCGFQWRAAHRATLGYLEQGGVEHLRVRFEEALGSPGERQRTFAAVGTWLGVDPAPLVSAALGDLPPVMATCRPRMNRWFKKAPLLRPVLERDDIRELTESLGFRGIDDNDA